MKAAKCKECGQAYTPKCKSCYKYVLEGNVDSRLIVAQPLVGSTPTQHPKFNGEAMAGQVRPKCKKCDKWYKFNWDTETFVKNCKCK